MGLHFVNLDLLEEVNKTGKLDPARPQIVLYEAQPNGTLQLTGADFLVYAEAWDAIHPGVTPQLMGQIFHYFEAPNRFGLPALCMWNLVRASRESQFQASSGGQLGSAWRFEQFRSKRPKEPPHSIFDPLQTDDTSHAELDEGPVLID